MKSQIRNIVILSILLAFVCSSCVTVGYHTYADTDFPKSKLLIERLKSDTLIIVLPTYSDKIRLLKGVKTSSAVVAARKKKDLLMTYADREKETKTIVSSFQEKYKFTPILFMPDSLVHAFEDGEDGVFFVNDDLQLDPSLTYANRRPIKFLKIFDNEWQVRIENKILPNPFPNHISSNYGVLWLIGVRSDKDVYVSMAAAMDRRFSIFYENPGERIKY